MAAFPIENGVAQFYPSHATNQTVLLKKFNTLT